MLTLINRLLTVLPIIKSLNGNKTVIGIISLLVYMVGQYYPDYASYMVQIAGWLGITLLPIGVAHKVVKDQLDADTQ